MKGLKLAIDASNISSGGGLTHLVELLRAADPNRHHFESIVMWASQSTLDSIPNRSWLLKRTAPVLEKNYLYRAIWQWLKFGKLAEAENCLVLFIPGGSFLTNFHPVVVMNQNLLPFDWTEIKRYGFSLTSVKWLMLRFSQTYSFKHADGVIFLTKHAKNSVLGIIGQLHSETAVISHGLNKRFFNRPRKQKELSEYNNENSLKLIYVSSIAPYKHHNNVFKAIWLLRKKGVPVVLDLYGSPSISDSNYILDKQLKLYDPTHDFIRYNGLTNYDEIHTKYLQADIAIFASSCETFGQILIEGIAAGLPTACSNMSAMPEILGINGVYFDPLNPESIKNSILKLISSVDLREQVAHEGYKRAKKYSWIKCADETFDLLNSIAYKTQRK
jgi:glycosyltransferase involved in cell wall biosynthesis|tara:strand:- start:317 stop:1477 length:1161 start_codon:yes stop_codon:yes gene_type:complete